MIGDVKVIIHPALPITPTLAEDVVRSVRHGLADVLEWLGEDVGPKPGEATHVLFASDGVGSSLFVSREVYARLVDGAP